MVWSPEMFTITGLASEGGAPGLESYLTMIAKEDRDRAGADLKAALAVLLPSPDSFRAPGGHRDSCLNAP